MKTLLLGLAAWPLIVGNAWAVGQLSDAQLDRVTAGALPSCAGSSMCSGMSTTETSTTFTTTNSNGVVMTKTTNSGPVTMTLGGETGGTGGTTGSTGGTTGNTGGSTGNIGGTTGTTTPAAPVFPLTITVPQQSLIVTAPIGIPGT